MDYYIKEIKLKEEFSHYSFIEEDNSIKNLSKINIFVGSNNAGKSQFMRRLFQKENLEFFPSGFSVEKLLRLYNDLVGEISSLFSESRIFDYGGLLEKLKEIKIIEIIQEELDFTKEIRGYLREIARGDNNRSVTSNYTFLNGFNFGELSEKLLTISVQYKGQLSEIMKGKPEVYKFKKIYVPTLRGLRPLSDNKDDLYALRTIKDYFPNLKDNLVFSGLNLYEELKNLLLGSLNDRQKVVKYQEFLGDTFFNGSKVALIPSVKSDVVIVKIGEEIEMPIYKLGDGIQSIIIQTFPLFANMGEKSLVFIEEPELFLHPGLQRKLMETFMKEEFKGFQFFLTTHSNHLLDITLDINQISVFSFKKQLDESSSNEKNANFIVENLSNEDNSLLEILGVKNSSVYLSNCTIWVEGITDRFYIRRYLQIYQESLQIPEEARYREDYHYAFIEYSGNNITHWSFLDNEEMEVDEVSKSMNAERICGKLFLISDKDSDLKKDRQDRLKEKLGDRFYCLECKEIENILNVDVLKKVVSDYEGETAEFNRKISEADYKNKYIGKYIDDHLTNKKRRGNYGSKSGTISNKVNFCEKALNHINSLEDMSDEAIELAKRVFEFIKSNNE